MPFTPATALTFLTLLPTILASTDPTTPLKITETDLRQYDGTDPSKPIYLAIDGAIFDVSASPAFYGPGGHYHHFVGRDATRAWVTECWDSGADQLTWRLDGGDLAAMFRPRWLDELMEKVADKTLDETDPVEVGDAFAELPAGQGELDLVARLVVEKFGRVSEAEKAARREADEIEAKGQIDAVVERWVKFFEGNAKYKKVGEVVKEEREVPPAVCEAAYKKRMLRYGKMADLMEIVGQMNAAQAGKQGGHEEL